MVSYNVVCDPNLVPISTKTYKVIPNKLLIDNIREKMSSSNLILTKETFIINRTRTQLFAIFDIKSDINGYDMSIGAVNSYNKVKSLGLAIGANVHLCSNLSFSSYRKLRKHTLNILNDFDSLIDNTILVLNQIFLQIIEKHTILKDIKINEIWVKSIIGHLLYDKYITPMQTSSMISNIKKDFPDTFFDLLMHFTDVMKLEHPGNMAERTIRGENFIIDKAERAKIILMRNK